LEKTIKKISENNLTRKDLLSEIPLTSFEKDEEANDQ